MVFISASHGLSSIVDELITRADCAFGLPISPPNTRERWRCALMASCEGYEDGVKGENASFIFLASAQGGCRWDLYLIEVESCGGRT